MSLMVIKKFRGSNLKTIYEKVRQEFGSDALIIEKREEKHGIFGKVYEVLASPRFPKSRGGEVADEIKELREEVRELREWVKYLITRIQTLPAEKRLVGKAQRLYKQLVAKGVEKALALSIVEEVLRYDMSEEAFKDIISGYIRMSPGILDYPGRRVIAFVGPTGVGKTTTLVKVAANLAYMKGRKVGIITTDRFRVGAAFQLGGYAEQMKVPFEVAPTLDKLKDAVRSMWHMDAILIDTIGRSHYDAENIRKIREVLEGVKVGRFEVHLLISSSYREDEITQIIRAFSILAITHIVFTKLDETSSPGVIINISSYVEKPLSYYTTGQRVPEDIMVATPSNTAKVILGNGY